MLVTSFPAWPVTPDLLLRLNVVVLSPSPEFSSALVPSAAIRNPCSLSYYSMAGRRKSCFLVGT